MSYPVKPTDVMVGSYSLESLTTGMYENPLHCIREYVQNGFDAIRTARSDNLLESLAGVVAISITGSSTRPTLTVEDNGVGIPAMDATGILVSVGASRKRSNTNAGFRGIGRLAGIAYCTTLRFTTTSQGETVATVVEFDCGRMRGFMRPNAETQDIRMVIQSCVTTSEVQALRDNHGTKVEMIGLAGLGLEFTEIEKLVPYLRQVCPIDFSDRFTFADQIRNFAIGVGQRIPTVEIETRYKRERTQILKAYDNATPTSNPKSPSTIVDIEVVSSAELGWFGWIGRSNFKGELTDNTVAGIRFRVKNIQIDGSDLIEALASELTAGGTEGRLQRYAVGEIYITNQAVVPNARRDGFEDGPAWRLIRADIKTRVAKRVVALVRLASNSRPKIKAIANEIATLKKRLDVEAMALTEIDTIAKVLDGLLIRLKPDKLTGGKPNEIGGYVSEVKNLRERLQDLRAKPPVNTDCEDDNEDTEWDDSEEQSKDEGESGADAAGADMEQAERSEWSADEILPVLRTILIGELGTNETNRLMDLAIAELEAR